MKQLPIPTSFFFWPKQKLNQEATFDTGGEDYIEKYSLVALKTQNQRLETNSH
jgi:hypothetical protein